ncbi:MAG: hypothetical protein K2N20_05705 [Helicobacter sp.]|nr:hypothetical protein [Helicobacter sp.]
MANTTQEITRADRSKTIGFRVSERFYNELLAQATTKDLRISEYLRLALAKIMDDEKQMQAAMTRRKR